MTGLPENIEELLTELVEKSRDEMNIMVALADAIRRTDDQLLREVRSVTMHHELRREEIMGELNALASRLCALPRRPIAAQQRASINHQPRAVPQETSEPFAEAYVADPRAVPNPAIQAAVAATEYKGPGGSWREAARKIDDELEEAFGNGLPRH
ncbi:MAG: hypothetical protein KDJ37_04340 [Hyphomicrobiaceae bacterium]|nr:hypothetical protein [Hyphomicrobiaceae bacterium]